MERDAGGRAGRTGGRTGGEQRFCPVKPGDHVTINVPSPHSLISEKHNVQKILELTRKMMELLIREEGQHIEGHKDLYKDVMMKNQPPLTSSDVSSNRNLPERCAGPLYTRDCPWEDLISSSPYPEEELIHVKVVVKEEEEPCVAGEQQFLEEEEEEEGDMMMSGSKEKDIFTELCIAPSPGITNCSEIRQALSHDCGVQDVITRESPGRNPITPNTPTGSLCPSNLHKAGVGDQQRTHNGETSFRCSECGKCFSGKLSLAAHKRSHTEKGPFSCTECGKCFVRKSLLSRHEVSHTDEKPFSCSECGKWYIWKGNLVAHLKSHAGYSCSECGKYFARKLHLTLHTKTHPHKTITCPVCGKCFIHKSQLVRHEKAHSIEKPFSCSECGKCFAWKSSLVTHVRGHSDDKPHSCSECGKRFIFKSYLAAHEKAHQLKKLYR